MSEINSDKVLVKKVFDMWFSIPVYQRPYVWGNEEISDLLDDISYAAKNSPNREYFMGSIVFQGKPRDPEKNIFFSENDLLDGQQRLTSLLLLMAVIRDLAEEKKLKDTCQEFICQEENPYKGIPERLRITSGRAKVQEFMEEYIKPDGGTLAPDELQRLSENSGDVSVANMASAILQMNRYFTTDGNISKNIFFQFLMNYVLMIYVSTEDLEDAFRLFTVLNARGIPLRNSDILKAVNLGFIKDTKEQEKFGEFWTEIENEHGEDFDRFLSFIRTLLVKEKARLNLLKEFEEKIYAPQGKKKKPLLEKGKDTLKYIKRFNEHHSTLFSGNNYDISNSWKFDNLLVIMEAGYWANDWIPPLLAYYDKFKTQKILDFLIKLDNKFSGDWISQETPTFRIENMNYILKKIENTSSPGDVLDSDAFDFDSESFFRNLEGKVYGRRWAKYILLKLDFLIQSHSEKKSGYDEISIEHILPQTPLSDSQWCIDFTDDQRDSMTHLLGNLVLMSRKKNTSQGRIEYQKKKEKYFKSNIETFPNSVRVLTEYNQWIPKELQENYTFVIDKLKEYYL